MQSTITSRVVATNGAKLVHMLNYTTGKIMSFDLNDGLFLLAHRDEFIRENSTSEVAQFLTEKGKSIVSRRFRSALLALGMHFSFPTIVNIEINRRCVLDCIHCYIPSEDLKSKKLSFWEQMTDGELNTLLDELVDMGVFLIVLTGGEPFLNKRLQQMLYEMARRGIIAEIFSNLQILPRWFREADASDFLIGRIQTSVYSVDASVHDSITRRKGSLAKTLANIDFLSAKGYYIEVATPLMRVNFDSRHETREYFQKKNIQQDFSWPILDEYYGSTSSNKISLNISEEQAKVFYQENPDFFIKSDFSDPDRFICAAGKALFSISANGDVFPCSQFPKAVGNLSKAPVSTIIKSPDMVQIASYKIRDIPVLPDSSYNFCMGNNYVETGDPFTVPSSLLQIFKAIDAVKKGGEEQ